MTEMTACRELKPCPFCTDSAHTWCDPESWKAACEYVICDMCECSVGPFKTSEEAIAAWNTRPDSGEAQPFGWWIELPGEGFGQFVRDQYFMSHLKDAGFVIAETPVYTHPPTPSPDLSPLTALVGRWRDELRKYPEGSQSGAWIHGLADEMGASLKQSDAYDIFSAATYSLITSNGEDTIPLKFGGHTHNSEGVSVLLEAALTQVGIG